MNPSNELRWIDYLIILIYFVFVLGIGFVLKRFVKTSADFLLSGRSIPAWIAGLAFLSFSVAIAYFVAAFNNIMDVLQLVFAFVNAPLFATFLLGMFWKRATGHGAFFGLLCGTVAAAVHHGLTISSGSTPGIKGAWIATAHVYPSQMAQNFYTAIYAWTVCFLTTIVISLLTKPRPEEELKGLVYALTEKAHEKGGRWFLRPVPVGIAVLILTLILNLIFR